MTAIFGRARAAALPALFLPALFLLALVVLALAGPAAGQTPAPEAAPDAAALDSPEAVRAMVARLSDAEVRALLLERLDAEAEARAEPGGLAELAGTLEAGAEGFAEGVSWAIRVSPNLADGVGLALSRFLEPRGTDGVLALLATLLLALAAGAGAALLLRRTLRRLGVGRPDEAEPPDAPGQAGAAPPALGRQLRLLGTRFAAEAAEAAIVFATAWGVICLLTLPEAEGVAPSDNLVLWFFLKQPVLYGLAMATLTRFLLAPDRPALRLIAMDTPHARLLANGLVVFALIAGMRAFLLSFLGGHGVDLAMVRLGFWMSLALYGWLFWLAWRARAGLTQSLIGEIGAPTPGERRLAEAYPWIAMGLIALFWALSETFTGLRRFDLLDSRLPLTLLLLVFAPAADRVVRALVYRVRPPEEGSGEAAERAFAATRRGYVRIGRILLAALTLILVAQVWGITLSGLAAAGIGAQLAGRLIEALVILGAGYVAMESLAIWINGRLARERGPEPDAEEPGGGEGGGSGGSRLATVLPLISFAAQGAILVVTVLTALSSLGIDTTHLLAGAGIVGLAIGFGAQTLVADIVSGLFFLIDDAFRTGEYVEVDGTVGTVEKISVRSLRLRHHEGRIHTIPFGQIPKITNYSRDWVIMKLRFTVPFDTDLEKVRKLFKRIGQDMMADERFRDDFLQPFKSQGVFEVDDVGIVIRGKFMAKPGRQWTLRKEIYARVQRTFEENGLQFARKEVRVKIDADPGQLSAEQREAVGAAAAEAAVAAGAPHGSAPADR